MLKFQIVSIVVLLACVAFVSCERMQGALEPAVEDMMDDDSMTMEMMLDTQAHKSWASVGLPAPGPQADATSAAETGEVHGKGTRVAFINDIGAMANKEGTEYPVGTVIVKEIMDDTNTFVQRIATMMKTADSMYAGHNGWIYKKYARADENSEYMQVKGAGLEDAGNGCHSCHAEAGNDSVFVQLPADDGMADDDMVDDAGDDMVDDAGDDTADDAGDDMVDDAGDDTADDAGDDTADDAGDDMADDAGDDTADDAGDDAAGDAGDDAAGDDTADDAGDAQ